MDTANKLCCAPMKCIELAGMNDVDGIIYICPVCLQYYKEESGQLEAEEAFNIIGANVDDIENFENLSDEELSKIFIEQYEDING